MAGTKEAAMHWAAGIDVGESKIAGALVDNTGKTSGFQSCPMSTGASRGVAAVKEAAQRLLAFAEAQKRPVAGIGVAVPGAVDIAAGVVLRAPNLGWEDVPLKRTLEADLGLPVEVELDVRAAALGVMLSEVGSNCRDFVYVTIGTGIGAGIVVNGKLHHGAHFCSGEIGHCVLVEDGPRCGCGQRGCFEALAAGGAIAERAGRLVNKTTLDSTMASLRDANGRIDPQHVFQAALANDPLACAAVRRTAEYIGRRLAILINVLDPQKIIVGGGNAKGGESLLGLIRQYTAQYTLHRGPKRTPIVLSPDLDNLPVVALPI